VNYETLKEEIKEIAKIAGTVPEPFRQRCFDLLLENLLATSRPPALIAAPPAAATVAATTAIEPAAPALDALPTPAQVRVFMQKTGVTQQQLSAVVTIADGEVHFLREPAPAKIAQGQIQWSLLLALKSGLMSNSFVVDPEAVRSICQDKGFYDKTNFAQNFKQSSTAKLFKKPLKAQGEPQGLSTAGIEALGVLVKSLAGSNG
jgi:hypothetical protein